MKESAIRTRAKQLAIKIYSVCEEIKPGRGRAVLINQIVRSATSIGANIHEANYGSSRADFINKLQLALKECAETEYWIDLLEGTGCISMECARELLYEAGILHRMLSKSITTAKENGNLEKKSGL